MSDLIGSGGSGGAGGSGEYVAHRHADPRITFPLAFTIFFSVLNGVMFNVAIPEIALDFQLKPSEVSWIITAYMITFALGSLVYGKLADALPVRRLITIGLVLLNLGSLLGFVAQQYPLLIVARVMQASGGAAIPAIGMLVATRYFPQEYKGRVLGVIASTVSVAAGVGPILGGIITDVFNWRLLFLMTLLTLGALPFLRAMLPKEEARPMVFDYIGAVLIILGVGGLLISVTHGILALAIVSLAILAGFVYRIRTVSHPFIHPSLFAIASYRNTLIVAALTTGSMFGIMFATPIMLSQIWGMGAWGIGLVMFPGAMSAAVMGRVGGSMTDSIGGVRMITVGAVVLMLGHLATSTAAGSAPGVFAAVLVMSYVGFSFLQSAMPHTVSSGLPPEHTGVGMGTYSMFFFSSGSFFTAFISRALDMGQAGFHLNPVAPFSEGWLYSNVFFVLALIVLLALVIFRVGCAKKC